ncbi:unnamed protein product [Meloidogyne enterolobii]|uniref:T-cell immunomodulatory protein TIP C2 domain-containing protein n=2 Tax=Meloidogyne enterolobii TaxID=390850 RepID=A0A6V7XLP6_MELEN|nr:unnamed protein product [Meloidogyne enterolobii]
MRLWPSIFVFILMRISQCSIVNIGDDKPIDPLNGRICGIGDMNKDGNTDLIVQQRTGSQNKLVVYLQSEGAEFRNGTQHIDLGKDGNDVFCNVGDFNGDSCPDLFIVSKIDDTSASFVNKIASVFSSRPPTRYQAKVYLNGRNDNFVELPLCFKTTDSSKSDICTPYQFIDHPSLVDINGDGITDIIGFQAITENSDKNAATNSENSFVCLAGNFQEDVHGFDLKICKQNFPVPRQVFTGFTPIFTDLDRDLSAELIFVDQEENNSSGQKKRLVVWKYKEFTDSDHFKWELNNELTVDFPNTEKSQYLASPLVADVDSDGFQEILVPLCDSKECTSVSTIWCYKFNETLNKAQWRTIALDFGNQKATIFPEVDGDTRVLFRIGDFSQNGFPDLIATISLSGGMKVPLILENVIDTNTAANFNRKYELSKKPQRILQKDVQNVRLSAFFDLKEDGNLDIMYEYEGPNGPMINFIKCDDKGDTTFLKVQIFTGPECSSGQCCDPETESSRRVKIGSGIAWQGACVSIRMADSGQGLIEQGMRNALQCQIPQTSHRILHNPFVLFGLSRSPNFVEEVHLGGPRWPELGKLQKDFIRQIVPNSRVIVIPPGLQDRSANWTSRLYVTPSRLIILSILVMVSMCIILLVLIAALHLRERQQDKKERQAQTHRFHFDAM